MRNSWPTHEGGPQVAGAVTMAVDENGFAVPVTDDTPIGVVSVSDASFERLARLLAAHAIAVGNSSDPEKLAAEFMEFAGRKVGGES